MAVSETTQPALLRGEDEGKRKVKPKIRAKVGKSKRGPNGRHPWYDQFDEVREAEAEGVHPELVRLAHCVDAEDEEGAVDAMLELQATLDSTESALREAEERADYSLGMFVAANEENGRLRDLAERHGYGGAVEGAGPRSGGIPLHHTGPSLLAAMGIDPDF
jgi:hypothetical protein